MKKKLKFLAIAAVSAIAITCMVKGNEEKELVGQTACLVMKEETKAQEEPRHVPIDPSRIKDIRLEKIGDSDEYILMYTIEDEVYE